VTIWLNVAAAVSLALWAIDLTLFPDPRPRRRRLLWSAWLGMALCQAVLALLHPRLDALLHADTFETEPEFWPLHRVYLWLHTVQWALALGFTALWLGAWRAIDRGAGQPFEQQ
jgi:hypothetical protein